MMVIVATVWVIHNFKTVSTKYLIQDNTDHVSDYDGKEEEQNFEILKTKDIDLGYVPKNILLSEYQKLADLRQSLAIKKTANATNIIWTERGPDYDVIGPSNGNTRPLNSVSSGRIRGMWVDLADPSKKTVWVGGIDGGLWKNSDITTTPSRWTLANDFFSNLSVSSICQDPVNTNIMYFATGEKTVNADGVKGGGVWKSIDNGLTWNLLANTTNFWNASKIICDSKGDIYLATIGNSMGLQRSNDGGKSWANITPLGLNLAVTDMKVSSNGRMHIVCGYLNGRYSASPSGYRFTDNPETVSSTSWSLSTTLLPNTDYNVELGVSGNTVYALPSNSSFQTPQVYKSTDGGLNWAKTLTSPPTTANAFPISGGQAWYDIALAVDQINPNNVLAGGLNCYRSVDGGDTWINCSHWYGLSSNYIHADQHAAIWNNSELLVGTYGGIFYSTDNGLTFNDKNSGLRIKQLYSCAIHPTSTNYFLAGAQDNGVHQFVNSGMNKSTEVTGGDGGFVHIDQDEPRFQFGSYVYNNYRVSRDGGQTWVQMDFNNSGLFINPTDYDDYSNKMYCAGAAGQFNRWEDPQTGSTFTQINLQNLSGNRISAVKVSPYTPNTVFFGSQNGGIVKVTNIDQKVISENYIGTIGMAGKYISNIEIGTSENYLISSISNYGSSHVWATKNGGNAWNDISGNLPNIPVRWAMFYPDDDTKAIIATELGVYETDFINGPSTIWVNNSSFPVVRTDMLKYRKTDGLIAAATHGRGLFTSVIPKTIPYIRFSSHYIVRSETGNASLGCRLYRDYQMPINIDLPATGDVNVLVSTSSISSATLGVDYDITTNNDFINPSNSFKFINGSTSSKSISIRVYDDAEIEPDEVVTLNISASGSTNALVAPSAKSFSFYISDNDLTPTPPFVPIGPSNANIKNETPFKSTDLKYRLQCIYSSTELNAMGIKGPNDFNALVLNVISKGSTRSFNSFTVQLANTNLNTLQTGFVNTQFQQVYLGNYTTALGTNTFNFASPFSWDGKSNILVQYCFDNSGFPNDIASDIVEGADDPLFGNYCSLYSNPASPGGSACLLTSSNVSISRPKINFGLKSGNPIETAINQPGNLFIGNNNDFYSVNASGNILSYLKSTGLPLGCINTNIAESGNAWQPFNGGQRSQKVFDIIANNGDQPYKIGLYFTSKEMGGFLPTNIKIATTSAANASQASTLNSTELPTSFKSYGDGFVFFCSVNKYQRFFLVNNLVTLPLHLISFGAHKDEEQIKLYWKTTNEDIGGHFNIEKSTDGNAFKSIWLLYSKNNSANENNYDFIDTHIDPLNYYRLKIFDRSGKYFYSQIVLVKDQTLVNDITLTNPFNNFISVHFNIQPRTDIIAELYNTQGKKIVEKRFLKTNSFNWNMNQLVPEGIYILKLYFDNKVVSKKLLKK